MKYRNYVEQLDSDNMEIHITGEDILEKEADHPILLVSHELDRTGAPIELLYMAKILLRNDCQVFMLSILDGALAEDFLQLGCVVMLFHQGNINIPWLKKLGSIFPTIVVNTLPLAPLVTFLAPSCQNMFWWIHENSYWFEQEGYCENVPAVPSLHILSASPKTERMISQYMGRQSQILNVMVEDEGQREMISKNDSKIHFLWAGTIEQNKAPELLLEAILKLPWRYFALCDFTFCGDGTDTERKNLLINFADNYENIAYIPRLPHSQLMELMDRSDAVVVCSIEETTSLVAVEGLMMGKVLICSDGCGVTDYLEDGVNALIYPSGNCGVLDRKIRHAVDHFQELESLRRAGREVYCRNYTEESFEKSLLSVLGMNNS